MHLIEGLHLGACLRRGQSGLQSSVAQAMASFRGLVDGI